MSHSAEKNPKGDPLGTSGFVDFLEKVNKTGTSKVGAISKAQKAQNTFFKKNLTFLVFFSFRKCRIVPEKIQRGTL